MVINSNKPYDTPESSDGEETWEIIDDTAPLVAADAAQLSSGSIVSTGGAVEQTEGTDDLELREEEVASQGVVDESGVEDDSLASGVSSITIEHTVGDTEAEKGEDDKETKTEDSAQADQNKELRPTAPQLDTDVHVNPPLKLEQDNEAPTAPAPQLGAASGAPGIPDALVETLLQMGFEREQIEKSIGALVDSGTPDNEINADSVISEMMGENEKAGGGNSAGSLQSRLNDTWGFVENSFQNFDSQHQISRSTHDCVQTVGRSAQEFWSNVKAESQRFRSDMRETCDQASVQAREATAQARYKASSAKDSICRANEQYGIAEKVATAAALGGAALLVLGNPRAGVGAMAVAGATLAAGEAMRQSSEQANSTYTKDYGLDEGLHLD